MSVIDEVKQKTDIVEVIGQYTTLTKAGKTFRGLCPFHSEKRPSFYVYPEQQSWHCFGACNTGGDVFSFIMKKQNIDFGEALRFFAQRAGVTVPSMVEQGARKDEKDRLYSVNSAAAGYFHDLLLNSKAGEKARSYLERRGISAETITRFQLGFSLDSWQALRDNLLEVGYTEDGLLEAGLILKTEEGKEHDRFRNRLIFPIKDAGGHTTGFGARVLDDSLPKYLNSPQTPVFDKSGTIYGIDLALPAIREQGLVVIVEGYMDVITAHQNGFNNVVASMGTSITEKQITILKRLSRNINVVLALDADAAGEEAMLRCVDYENSLDTEVKVIVLPEGKDPDDVIRGDAESWQRLLDEALPVVDYAFNIVSSRLDLSTARDKKLLVERLGPVVTGISDPIRRAHYIQKLSRLTAAPERTVEATLSRIKPARRAGKPAPETAARASLPFLSRPLEENCLALLLQYPGLKNGSSDLLPEYFENSENREIFIAWQKADDMQSLRDSLDITLREHFDNLINKNILATEIEQRYNEYVLRLKEEYLRGLLRKGEAALVLEAETGGAAAELAKLKEQGIELNAQLGEVFTRRARRGQGQRR